jgi:hypothetical protein
VRESGHILHNEPFRAKLFYEPDKSQEHLVAFVIGVSQASGADALTTGSANEHIDMLAGTDHGENPSGIDFAYVVATCARALVGGLVCEMIGAVGPHCVLIVINSENNIIVFT